MKVKDLIKALTEIDSSGEKDVFLRTWVEWDKDVMDWPWEVDKVMISDGSELGENMEICVEIVAKKI